MCGIAGVIDPRPYSEAADLPHRFSELLKHRGPDDKGFLHFQSGQSRVQTLHNWTEPWRGDGIALVHRRLSILDLSPLGWQPMSTADGRYHVVFNGEVYNYLELRAELEQLGHRFVSKTDSEVLLHAYVEWKESCLSRFKGMFAFAIFDHAERSLFLARDPFGIKPLFYSKAQGRFAFASEIPALLACPWISRRCNVQSAFLYLRSGLADFSDQTQFTDILQLQPGRYMKVGLDGRTTTEPTVFWSPRLQKPLDLSFDEATSRLRELFISNIGLHLRSDVPVGSALSGGIDSSAVVMGMHRVAPPGSPQLSTFSYIAEDAKLSEEKWMDLVAHASNARMHKVSPDPDDLVQDLKSLIHVQGEPFGSTSIYAQYRIFKLVSSTGIKVVLDGQGADEYLAGYRFYHAARVASLLRQHRPIEAMRFAQACGRQPGASFASTLIRSADFILPPFAQKTVRPLIGKNHFPFYLNKKWLETHGARGESLFYSRSKEVLRDTLATTLTTTSLPQLLRYEDRNSMAFSIESRVPFLTTDIVEFCLSLPENYVISDQGVSKHVFREAMRGVVPDAILDRKDKIGFATPESQWIGKIRPWAESVLSSETARSIPLFNHDAIKEDWNAQAAGTRPYDNRSWRWLNFIEWAREFNVTFE